MDRSQAQFGRSQSVKVEIRSEVCQTQVMNEREIGAKFRGTILKLIKRAISCYYDNDTRPL